MSLPPPAASHSSRNMTSHSSDEEYKPPNTNNTFHPPFKSSYSVASFSPNSIPLIESVRNGWQSHSYHPRSASPETDTHPPCIQLALSILAAPRFRRYVIVYLVLFLLGWAGWSYLLYPHLQERSSLLHALDPSFKEEAGGWFGTNSLPRFDDLTHIRTLDRSLLPVALLDGEDINMISQKRLVVVGDVHGCKKECMFRFSAL